ncbi:MAG: heme-binding protein [Planctomycetes bacterium]|nr:heme-binding protein [Planctomycetota bacterium]
MSSVRSVRSMVLVLIAALACAGLPSCGGGGSSGDQIFLPTYATVVPMTAQEVDIMVRRAAEATDSPNLIVAVVDRVGRPLAIWSRQPAPTEDDVNIALSIARTGAFMSSSQGPITSRTLEFISTFHFPSVFGALTRNPIPNNAFTLDPSLASQHTTVGVAQTAQGPLWQIFSSNRGAPFADPDVAAAGGLAPGLTAPGFSTPSNGFADMRIPPAGRVDVTGATLVNQPGTGLTYLAGGIPIYKAGDPAPLTTVDFPARVVGGFGCYITDAMGNPDDGLAEFVTIRALGGINFDGSKKGAANFAAPRAQLAADEDLNFFFPYEIVPPQGLIYLVGVLLPYTQDPVRPVGLGAGSFLNGGYLLAPGNGGEQPWGWIIGPRADPLGNLTQLEVETIVNQGIAYAEGTRAAIRVPNGSATKMVFAVTNLRGEILGVYRMEDSPVFSYDVSITKARCVTYLSSFPGGNPDMAPQDAALLNAAGIPTGIAGSPGEFGVAITTRTLTFLTQPFFPPGIDSAGTKPGPLFALAAQNAQPNQFNRMANAAPSLNLQSGIIFFPGSAPLYKNGQLVGGYGVSGDGVEQDDFVTAGGYVGFEPPAGIRADQFTFEGVRLPYFKFPILPGPGGN